MPKKTNKDGSESKKSRRASSSKEARNSSATSPIGSDILPPPTPTATHLVASNPFDDPPINNTSMMHGPRYSMHSPMHGGPGMGSPPSLGMGNHGPVFPWGPTSSHRGMRPYSSPGPPNWTPNHGEMLSPNNSGHIMQGYQGMPMHQPQGMSPTGYSYNRPMMVHPGMPGHSHPGPYRGPSRMPMTNRFVEINSERMSGPRPGMNMHGMHIAMQPGNMKLLTRPCTPATQPNVALNQPHPPARKTSSNKSETKYGKGDSNRSTTPKSKRKARTTNSDAKADSKVSKSNASETEDKNKLNSLGTNSKMVLPTSNGTTAPHAVPPTLPQTCVLCNQEIKIDDCICCLASCSSWYHRTCTGLTPTAYNCLRSEELALWACDNCLRTKEILSVRPREQEHSAEANTNNTITIVGKA